MKCLFENVNVYYETLNIGEGDVPLVFLHGWGGSTKSFEFFAKEMSKYRPCVLIDFPPFGLSSKPQSVWNVEKYASCVLEVLKCVGAKKCDIVAHSFGGRVALELAGKHNICSRLMLTGCAGICRKSFATRCKICSFKFKKFLSKIGLYSKQKLLHAGSEDYKNLSPVMKQTFQTVVNYDQRYLFKNISCPTLLVWGRDDGATPFCWTKIFKKHIEDCEVIELDGDHFAYVQNSTKFLKIMQSFLSKE